MNMADTESLLELPPDMEIPAWCAGATLRYSMHLNRESPSNNDIRGLNPKAYKGLRQLWCNKILSKGLHGQTPDAPLERAALVLVRRCSGSLDWDNALGGLKPIVDCLVVRSLRRSPNGLGLVRDDSPKYMPYPPFMLQRSAAPGEGSLDIAIFELPPAG
ncbi:hypothetical protein [Burkholderia cenocepacia]|uniref:hypothetical protein n=1 Tax=Burkholderia cenocepacia TaxID=95486 RepID=UPI0007615E15|nr:hypothetical protein [Burkholderia cenocepacia]KWU23351.1 hypothetical protein AS149_37400 [Burkholderia cenocepacia]